MASSHSTTYSPSTFGGNYMQNLGDASRVFIGALLAIKPSAPASDRQPAAMSERDRMKTILELNRLAASFDSTMPNQASEMRHFASHY